MKITFEFDDTTCQSTITTAITTLSTLDYQEADMHNILDLCKSFIEISHIDAGRFRNKAVAVRNKKIAPHILSDFIE